MQNKKVILGIITTLLIISIFVGISYAYWLNTNKQEGSNIAKTGCFNTTFTENSSAIKLEDIYPIDDSQGEVLTPFTFTIKNTCSYDANYQINLETISSTLKLKNIRVKLSTYDSNLLSNYVTATKVIDDATDSRKLLSGTLAVGSSISYDLRVWLDKDTTLDDINNTIGANNSWEGKITVITTLSNDLTKYNDNTIAATPILYQGLIPVKYDDSGNVLVADTTKRWYNYKVHEWANAVLVNCSDSTIKSKYFNNDMSLKDDVIGTTISMDEILQMYVWIPRYRYKLFNAENGTASEQAVQIEFEKASADKSTGTKNGEWLTHPAFTFGNTELPGFWAAKFEASGSTDNYQIKPNQKSLTSINLATMYNTSRSTAINALKYGLNAQSIDTHMMKNMEWGAIAFLTNSIYGRYNDSSTCIASGCEVWINNINTGYGNGTAVDGQPQWGPSITGCAGTSTSAGVSSSQTACASGYDWKTKGVNASTTGNQYGIYDMSGGAWEYVMGVQKDSSGNVQVGSSGFSISSLPDSKYYDLYDYQAEDGVGYTRYHLGDATREVLKNTSSQGQNAWWSDYSYNIYSLYPWVARGGRYNTGSSAGVFYFDRHGGWGGSLYSFRSVLSLKTMG